MCVTEQELSGDTGQEKGGGMSSVDAILGHA